MSKNKLKVSTNPVYTANEQKILDFVGYYSPAGINHTTLAKNTHIKLISGKNILTIPYHKINKIKEKQKNGEKSFS